MLSPTTLTQKWFGNIVNMHDKLYHTNLVWIDFVIKPHMMYLSIWKKMRQKLVNVIAIPFILILSFASFPIFVFKSKILTKHMQYIPVKMCFSLSLIKRCHLDMLKIFCYFQECWQYTCTSTLIEYRCYYTSIHVIKHFLIGAK